MQKFKKLLSMLLSLALLLGLMPSGTVFADTTHSANVSAVKRLTVMDGNDAQMAVAAYDAATGALGEEVATQREDAMHTSNIVKFSLSGIPADATSVKVITNLTMTNGDGRIQFFRPLTQLTGGAYNDQMATMISPSMYAVSSIIPVGYTGETSATVTDVDKIADIVAFANGANYFYMVFDGVNQENGAMVNSVSVTYTRPVALSSNNTLTSTDLTVNEGLLTIASGTLDLTRMSIANDVIDKLIVPAGASVKIFAMNTFIGNSNDFDNIGAVLGILPIGEGGFVAVKAENGDIKKYSLSPLNHLVNAYSKATHYTVSGVAHTLVANTTPIVTNTSINALIGNLNIPTGATVEVTDAAYNFNGPAEFIAGSAGYIPKNMAVTNTNKLWIMSEDKLDVQFYTITVTAPLSNIAEVTTKGTHYNVEDGFNSITAGTTNIFTSTSVLSFTSNLNFPDVVTQIYITNSGVNFANATEMINYVGPTKQGNDKLVHGDKLWILAEDGITMKMYSIGVADAPNSEALVIGTANITVNNGASTIKAGLNPITTAMSVDDFLRETNISLQATYGITLGNVTFNDAAAFKAGTASYSLLSDLMVNGMKFWVLSEDESTLKAYTITVTAPLSSNNEVSDNGHMFTIVDQDTSTIRTGFMEITKYTTVTALTGILNNTGTSMKIFSSDKIVTNASQYDSVQAIGDNTVIGLGSFLVSKAENGNVRRYEITTLSDAETVTSKVPHYVVADDWSTIVANNTPITTDTTAGSFLSNLNLPANAVVRLTNGNPVLNNANDILNYINAGGTDLIQGSETLNVGAKLLIVAQDRVTYKVYSLTVAPLSGDNTVVSKVSGEVTVGADTIASGTVNITDLTTASQLLGLLSKEASAVMKLLETATVVANSTAFDNATALSANTAIGHTIALFVKAADNSIKKYGVTVKESAPTYTESPSVINVTENTATLGFKASKESVLRYKIQTANLQDLDAMEMSALQGVNATTARHSTPLTELSPNTTYSVFLTNTSSSGLVTGVNKVTFTTLRSSNTNLYPETQGNVVVDNTNGVISSGVALELNTGTTVAELKAQLRNGVSGGVLKVYPANTVISNMGDTATATQSLNTDTLVNGIKVASISDDGAQFKVFTVTVVNLNSAPEWSLNFPTVTGIAQTTATYNVKSNESGSVKYKLRLLATPADNFGGIVASGGSKAILADTATTVDFANLQPDTLYAIDAFLVDGLLLPSVARNTVLFRTLPAQPVFVDAHTSVSSVTPNSALASFRVNESTAVKYLVKLTTDQAPSSANIQNSNNSVSVVGNVTSSITLTGLQQQTDYTLYAVAVKTIMNDASVKLQGQNIQNEVVVSEIKSIQFATPRVPQETTESPSVIVTPTPTAPVLPPAKIDVIIDGKKENIAEAKDTQKNGATTTTVTVDEKALRDKLAANDSGKKNQIVNVIIPERSGAAKQTTFSSASLLDVAKSNASVLVSTSIASYSLTNGLLNQITGNGTGAVTPDRGDVTLKISRVTDSDTLSNFNAALAKNVKLKSNLVDFELSVGGNSVTSTFTDFVDRTVTVPTTQSAPNVQDIIRVTTGIVVGRDGTAYHVPTWIITNNVVSPQVKIHSLSNSVYGLIDATKAFEDISNSKYAASIQNVASRLIIEGTSPTTFKPESSATRAEFATMLTKAVGLYRGEMGKTTFTDMSKVEKLNIGITVAADNNYISGYGNGILKPNQVITNKEFAQMLYNVVSKHNRLDKFKGTGNAVITTDWSAKAVAFVTSNGLIEGFSANKAITREQAAYAIEKLLQGMELINK